MNISQPSSSDQSSSLVEDAMDKYTCAPFKPFHQLSGQALHHHIKKLASTMEDKHIKDGKWSKSMENEEKENGEHDISSTDCCQYKLLFDVHQEACGKKV